ncbi:MAG: hypothetical protein LBU27_04535 [Candidatus Peribacteria bacterium]|nr:hypothetical protein [Candidatus Peribacteria bacterium]
MIYKGKNIEDFCIEASKYDVLAGHNIINFDMGQQEFPTSLLQKPTIDTIRLSSLIFIRNPYHKLIKTYKEDTEYLD